MTDKPNEIAQLRAEVRRLEVALEEERRRMRAAADLLERAPVAIQCYGPDGTTNLMNAAMQELIGLPDRSLAYGKFNILTDPDMRAQGVSQLFERAYAGEVVEVPELPIDLGAIDERWGHQRKQKVWFQEVIFPIRGESGAIEGTASFTWDITARKQTEQALLNTQRDQHLAVLAGGIAHDFNNLLTGILGMASLGLMETEPLAMRRCFEELQRAAEHAAALTRQLLAYAGKGRFVVRELDPSKLLNDMARLLNVTVPTNVSLRMQLGQDVGTVRADEAQLHQVVMNVVRNAVEAIGEAPGTVTVTTSSVEADTKYLAAAFGASDLDAGRYLCIEVSDTGCGMAPDTQRQMFDPFFTVKDRGHGLGLAATLGIVRSHGGAIRVYSELDRGTTIKILLPSGDGAVPVSAARNASLGTGSVGSVLVVDDEPVVRQLAGRALALDGWTVHTASDGREAVSIYEKHGEEIDLIVLDLTMPVMGGAEAFRELRRIDPQVRVLLTSGYNEQDTTSAFAGKGLAGFIQKPYRASALIQQVRALFEDADKNR